MSINELTITIEKLKEWQAIQDEATLQVESLKDEIKAYMLTNDLTECVAGTHIVRWTETISNRLDTTSLKRTLPDIYKSFSKQVTSRRFSISD